MIKIILLAAAFSAASLPAHAQSLILGLGWNYFSHDGSQDTATFDVEYHFAPFHEGARSDWAVGAVFSVSGRNDTFAGAGLVGTVRLRNHWFAEFSTMPGYYREGIFANRLGGDLQFRSLLGIGRSLPGGQTFSLALTHRSNASTNPFNPGVNSLLLRCHIAF